MFIIDFLVWLEDEHPVIFAIVWTMTLLSISVIPGVIVGFNLARMS